MNTILLRFLPSDLPAVFMILREKSQNVSQKGPEKKVDKYGKLGLTAGGTLR
jgi:hypothetical protein